MTANWIADTNRFNLEQPPSWVLMKLYEFDHMLVILPSRQRRQYLLARRRQYSLGLGDVAMVDNKNPDTNMCRVHDLVPIAPLKWKSGVVKWEAGDVDSFLDELRRRDTWQYTGGPDGKDPNAAWKAVEEHERSVAQKERRNLRDMFKHMAKDAWRSITARAGSRNKNAWDGNRLARANAAKGQRIMSRPTGRGTTR